MTQRAPVFDQIIETYLQRVTALGDGTGLKEALGVETTEDGFTVPLFDRRITVTATGLVDEQGATPSHVASVLACQYLLLCPHRPSGDHTLVTFKDFKDASPYVGGFKSTVEAPIAAAFSGRVDALGQSCRSMGGKPFETDVACQLAYEFQALPRVPVFLLFHDADDDFPAQCTLLFWKNAAHYLDMECLAMIGGTLALGLKGG